LHDFDVYFSFERWLVLKVMLTYDFGELAAAGVSPTGEDVHDSENVQSRTDDLAVLTVETHNNLRSASVRTYTFFTTG
jgi:hypothetical protein